MTHFVGTLFATRPFLIVGLQQLHLISELLRRITVVFVSLQLMLVVIKGALRRLKLIFQIIDVRSIVLRLSLKLLEALICNNLSALAFDFATISIERFLQSVLL